MEAQVETRPMSDGNYTKQTFLQAYPEYGYKQLEKELSNGTSVIQNDTRYLEELRQTEFPHMNGNVYLDHAGATMYAKSQLDAAFRELQSGLFGNPHSHTPGSDQTRQQIDAVRQQVLAFFNTTEQEYALIFTSGATAGLKTVGECFPWSPQSTFAHAIDSHTSVLGIRAYASQHKTTTKCIHLRELSKLKTAEEIDQVSNQADAPCHLFAFPAECNFSGTQHDLEWIERVQNGDVFSESGHWMVLLDAAKYVTTRALDLTTYTPDFLVVSFYKMFGYPTGLGALLVKRSSLPFLRKSYYGGGTVSNILATRDFALFRDSKDDASARFADGTQSFLSILSLKHGFEMLQKLSMEAIALHTHSLIQFLYKQLIEIKHWNQKPICEVYGNPASENHGSILALNFLRADESYVGYSEVSKLAGLHQIHLRTGCFCNPGACQTYLKLQDDDLMANMKAGHVCGDDIDLVNGVPTGAVRISVGYMTTYEDCVAFLEFVAKYFASKSIPGAIDDNQLSHQAQGVRLVKIALFPIKSCAAVNVDSWLVGSRGLLFDREWAIVDVATNKALSLKDVPELCFLQPEIDLLQQMLTIRWMKPDDRENDATPRSFTLALHETTSSKKRSDVRSMKLCLAECKARDASDAASQWLSHWLDRKCALVRVATDNLRASQTTQSKRRPTPTDEISSTEPQNPTIGFANQAQYLMISRQSVAQFNDALRAAKSPIGVSEDVFRANLIVDGDALQPFEEDTWQFVQIGQHTRFQVAGPCSRCSVINLDPSTGAFHRTPLQVLASYRRERASIFFGQFLTRMPSSNLAWITVHDPIVVE